MSNSDTQEQSTQSYMFGYFIVGTLAVGILLGLVGYGSRLLAKSGDSGLAWMTIAGGGFIAIVVIMIIVAVIYRAMGTHDNTQALGMPKGSVRSLLMFLVFCLLGVFVFFSIDRMEGERVQSRIIVYAGEDIGARIDQLGDVDILSIKPGENVMRGEGDDMTEVTTTIILFSRDVAVSDSVVDHINQIAIAIFSMASSIIGYYFGTRSQVPAFGRDPDDPVVADDGAGDDPAPATPPQAKADSPDWSLATNQMSLTLADDIFSGEIEFASTDLSDDQEFSGAVVPPENDRERYKDFSVSVSREGQSLTVEIKGPAGANPKALDGAQISVYPVDHEDVAISVDVA